MTGINQENFVYKSLRPSEIQPCQVREESLENSKDFTRRIHQSIQWRAGQKPIV